MSGSLYYALGTVDHDPLAQQKVDVNAVCAVAVSRDFDWIRVRGTGIFQSGTGIPSTVTPTASTRFRRIRKCQRRHELLIRRRCR
jgi:hypothetical protein